MKSPATLLVSTSLPLAVAWTIAVAPTFDGAWSSPAPPLSPPAITTAELGRLLFWDPILSGPMDVACASCHHPEFAWADGRDLSLGVGAVGLGPDRTDVSGGAIPVVGRNSQTVLNVALNGLDGRRGRRTIDDAFSDAIQARAPMFWDSRVRSLEEQALEPLKTFEEMRGSSYSEEVAVDSVVARLGSIPEYVALFELAFGSEEGVEAVTQERLGGALADFQRTLLAMNSPFDRFQAGDSAAMSAQQIRGMESFERARCNACHTGPMFSDFSLRTQGVAEHALREGPDAGAGRFRFRTPSLRNVALTAPYMHNGVFQTLEEVLRFYDAGRSLNPNVTNRGNGRNRANLGRGGGGATPGPSAADDAEPAPRPGTLDNRFRRVRGMSEAQMRDIIAFLEALTDLEFDRTIPERVPSGLTPGGAIGTD